MIKVIVSGSTKATESFLHNITSDKLFSDLKRGGERGKDALSGATPVDTGKAASSWNYTVEQGSGGATIFWSNSNREGGLPVVLYIQYGHGTGTGGYVPGRDFINPAMRPVFDQIAEDVWKKVTSG
jgi:hypothetical protein